MTQLENLMCVCMVCMVYVLFSISNTISRIFADLSHNISCGPQSWHFYTDVNVQFYFDTQTCHHLQQNSGFFTENLFRGKLSATRLAWNIGWRRRVLICIVEAELTHYLGQSGTEISSLFTMLQCYNLTVQSSNWLNWLSFNRLHCHSYFLSSLLPP